MKGDSAASRQAKIMELFQPGVTTNVIAFTFKVHLSTATKDLRALNWPLQGKGQRPGDPKPPSVNDTRILEIKEILAREPGITLKALGAKYGITNERVRQILKKFGVTKEHADTVRAIARRKEQTQKAIIRADTKNAFRTGRLTQIISLRKQGFSYQKIAKRLGVCAMTVWHTLHDEPTYLKKVLSPELLQIEGLEAARKPLKAGRPPKHKIPKPPKPDPVLSVLGSTPPTSVPLSFINLHRVKGQRLHKQGGLTWTELRAVIEKSPSGYKRKPDDEQVVRAAIAQWEASQVKHPESIL